MRASHQCEQGPPQCGRRLNASAPRINAGVASMRARPASMRPSHQCERGPHQCDRHIKVCLAHIKMAFSEQCEDIHINVGHVLFLRLVCGCAPVTTVTGDGEAAVLRDLIDLSTL